MSAAGLISPTTEPASLESRDLRSRRRVFVAFWIVALLLGFLQAWISRHDMYSDGISYLDIADAFRQGDKAAVNPYWSPLYPFLLSVAMSFLRPSPFWEFSVVHLVNLIIYVSALASFTYFLTGLIHVQRRRPRTTSQQGNSIPEVWLIAIGFTLFLWTSLQLITISVVSPDMCVAACLYLACGKLVRIHSGASNWASFAVFGLILGIGYLAKAPFFPMAFVFLPLSIAAAGNLRRGIPGVLLALSVFLLVAGPFVYSLSKSRGRLMFGDSWKLNCAWYVDDVPRYHWRGDIPGSGTALHPTRKLLGNPPLYEFNGPVGGTYPIWLDPSYWYAGIQPQFRWRGILRQLSENIPIYYEAFIQFQPALIVAYLAVCWMGLRRALVLRDISREWPLLVPAICALVMYAPVHVEYRMTGALVVLFWVALFFSVRVPDSPESMRMASSVCRAAVFFILASLGISTVAETISRGPRHLLLWRDTTSHLQWRIADGLKQNGLQPGDKVAWIRPHPFTAKQTYWWARVARLQIVAEVPAGQEDRFWAADTEARAQFMQSAARAGAKALIATKVPANFPSYGWQRIGATGYYLYPLVTPPC